jgi:hypothetical protein
MIAVSCTRKQMRTQATAFSLAKGKVAPKRMLERAAEQAGVRDARSGRAGGDHSDNECTEAAAAAAAAATTARREHQSSAAFVGKSKRSGEHLECATLRRDDTGCCAVRRKDARAAMSEELKQMEVLLVEFVR